MRKLIVVVALAVTALFAVPTLASARTPWYWSTQRASLALETYEADTATDGGGAFCHGMGHSMRSPSTGRKLYQRFACDLYAPGDDYLGSGVIRVTGQALRKYRWVSWSDA
jgi:hypothetical protein